MANVTNHPFKFGESSQLTEDVSRSCQGGGGSGGSTAPRCTGSSVPWSTTSEEMEGSVGGLLFLRWHSFQVNKLGSIDYV